MFKRLGLATVVALTVVAVMSPGSVYASSSATVWANNAGRTSRIEEFRLSDGVKLKDFSIGSGNGRGIA